MKKKDKDKVKASEEPSESPDTGYKQTLYDLQVQLVQLQRHVIRHGLKLLVVFEGRDAAGKDGTIKRIIEHIRFF